MGGWGIGKGVAYRAYSPSYPHPRYCRRTAVRSTHARAHARTHARARARTHTHTQSLVSEEGDPFTLLNAYDGWVRTHTHEAERGRLRETETKRERQRDRETETER